MREKRLLDRGSGFSCNAAHCGAFLLEAFEAKGEVAAESPLRALAFTPPDCCFFRSVFLMPRPFRPFYLPHYATQAALDWFIRPKARQPLWLLSFGYSYPLLAAVSITTTIFLMFRYKVLHMS
jgi:hypothetical protein